MLAENLCENIRKILLGGGNKLFRKVQQLCRFRIIFRPVYLSGEPADLLATSDKYIDDVVDNEFKSRYLVFGEYAPCDTYAGKILRIPIEMGDTSAAEAAERVVKFIFSDEFPPWLSGFSLDYFFGAP